MPPGKRAMKGINDSKQLSARQRNELVLLIRERALAIGIGAASVREIDRFNIYQASVLAIRRALARLGLAPDHVVVDGKAIRTLSTAHTAVVHGDARCYSVACASIVAKVTRDRVMRALAVRHPGYLWDHNMGYATKSHMHGIGEIGITKHHRRSFLPVRQMSLDFAPDLDSPTVTPRADVTSGVVSVETILDPALLAKLIDDAPPDASWLADGDIAS